MSKTATSNRKPKTTVIAVRVSPELRQDVEHAAIADGKTVSAYVVDVLVNKFAGTRPAVPETSALAQALAMAEASHETEAPLPQAPPPPKQAPKVKPVALKVQKPAQAPTVAAAAPVASPAQVPIEAPKAAGGSFMKQALITAAQQPSPSSSNRELPKQAASQKPTVPTSLPPEPGMVPATTDPVPPAYLPAGALAHARQGPPPLPPLQPFMPAPAQALPMPPARVPSWNSPPEARPSFTPPATAAQAPPVAARKALPSPPGPTQQQIPVPPRAPAPDNGWDQGGYQDNSGYPQFPYQQPNPPPSAAVAPRTRPPAPPMFENRAPPRPLPPRPQPMPRPGDEQQGGWGYTQGQYQPPAPQGADPDVKPTKGEVQRFLSFVTSKFRKPSGDERDDHS